MVILSVINRCQKRRVGEETSGGRHRNSQQQEVQLEALLGRAGKALESLRYVPGHGRMSGEQIDR